MAAFVQQLDGRGLRSGTWPISRVRAAAAAARTAGSLFSDSAGPSRKTAASRAFISAKQLDRLRP